MTSAARLKPSSARFRHGFRSPMVPPTFPASRRKGSRCQTRSLSTRSSAVTVPWITRTGWYADWNSTGTASPTKVYVKISAGRSHRGSSSGNMAISGKNWSRSVMSRPRRSSSTSASGGAHTGSRLTLERRRLPRFRCCALSVLLRGAARGGPPDAVRDAAGLFRGDLDELVLQVSALGGDQQRAAMPHQIPGEHLVAPAAVAVAAPEQAGRPVRATEVIDQGVMGNPVRPGIGPPSGNLPARVGRVAGKAVGARRDRDVRVDLALEGLQLDFLLRAGLGRTQPRIRVPGGEHHGVIADLGVELHFEELTGGRVAPQAADSLVLVPTPEVPQPDQIEALPLRQLDVLQEMPAVIGLAVLERVPDGVGKQLHGLRHGAALHGQALRDLAFDPVAILQPVPKTDQMTLVPDRLAHARDSCPILAYRRPYPTETGRAQRIRSFRLPPHSAAGGWRSAVGGRGPPSHPPARLPALSSWWWRQEIADIAKPTRPAAGYCG